MLSLFLASLAASYPLRDPYLCVGKAPFGAAAIANCVGITQGSLCEPWVKIFATCIIDELDRAFALVFMKISPNLSLRSFSCRISVVASIWVVLYVVGAIHAVPVSMAYLSIVIHLDFGQL